MTRHADEAWMVWLTSAELARRERTPLKGGLTLKARADFQRWFEAIRWLKLGE